MNRALAALVGSAVLYAVAVVWAATALPETGVPLHFGSTGRADRLGSRSEALWAMVLVGAGMLALFGGLVVLVRRGSLALMNVPHKDYWTAPERRPQLRRMLTTDVAALGTATLLLLTALEVLTVRAVDADPVALSPLFFVALTLYLLGVLAWGGYLYRRRYRPPVDDR